MKRYLIAVVTVFVLILNIGFAAEASVQTVKYDTENEILTVKGSADSKMQSISLEVLKGGVTAGQFDFADAEERFNMLVHADETLSADDGSWQFSFGFPADSKRHVIRVRTGINGEIEQRSIVAATNSEFETAMEMMNSAGSNDISDVLKKCAGILGLDCDTLEMLPDKNCDAMALRILNERDKQQNKVFAGYEQLEAVFNENLAVECVNVADGSNIAAVLEKYKEYFTYKNGKSYQIFEGLSADSQKNVYTNLAKADYGSPAAVDTAFGLETVRVRLAALRGYDELYDVLPQCADALEANISKYTALSKENQLKACSEIITNLLGKDVTKESLETIVSSAAEKYSSNGTTGGGSGGGGGNGGGTVSTGTTSQTPNIDVAAPNKPYGSSSLFNDIGSVSWAQDSIEELARRGVINGKADKIFAPNDTVTREEFVKMVVLALNITAEDTSCDFTDVIDDAWYKEYVGRAVGSGLVNGHGDGTFGVGENITRQDIAVILWNGIKSKVGNGSAAAFIDNDDVSDYAKEAVNAMRYLNIIDGYEDNTFRPSNAATRAEAAKLLYKAVQIAE
ncbi:MAG: S-layer homology domain-containing protein [Clostridiales bacterium]|nr:S-layer homology domain-containing protein [Clostridiales bacterium]